MADRNDGIIIDVGFAGDIKEFINEIKRELERADFSDSIGLDKEFQKQYKSVKTTINNLSKEIDKIQRGSGSGELNKRLTDVENTMRILQGSVKTLSSMMSGNDTQKYQDHMASLNNDLEKVTGAMENAAKATAALNKGISSAAPSSPLTKTVNTAEKELKRLEDIFNKYNQDLKGLENYEVKSKDRNAKNIATFQKAQDTYKAQQKGLVSTNEALKEAVKNKDLTQSINAYEEYISKLKEFLKLKRILDDKYLTQADQKRLYSNPSKAEEWVTNAKKLAETQRKQIRNMLNVPDSLQTKATSQEREQKIILNVEKGQKKKLENDINRILDDIQSKVYAHPIEVMLTTTTAYFNRDVERRLDQLIETGGTDVAGIAELKKKMQNSFDKHGNIEIGINTKRAEEKIKDLLGLVKGDLKSIKDEIGYSLYELSADKTERPTEETEKAVEREKNIFEKIKTSTEEIQENIKNKNELLEKEIQLLDKINQLTLENADNANKVSPLSTLEAKYNAFKPFFETGVDNTKEAAKAGLDYYMAYRNAIQAKVAKSDISNLTLGKTKDLFTGNYTQWKAKDTPLDMSGLLSQISRYKDIVGNFNPKSAEMINTLSDAINHLLSSTENTASSTNFLDSFSKLITSLNLSENLVDIEKLTKDLKELRNVLSEGDADLTYLNALQQFLERARGLADLADIIRLGGQDSMKKIRESVPVSSALDQPNKANKLKENVAKLYEEQGVTPLYSKMETMKSGLVKITSLVRDADGAYSKFTLNAKNGNDVVVKSIDDNQSALQKEISAFEKLAELADFEPKPPLGTTTQVFDETSENWQGLIELLREYGIEMEQVTKIMRNVDRGDESFQIFTNDGRRTTLGVNSDEVLFLKDSVLDVDEATKKADKDMNKFLSSLKSSMKNGGAFEFEALKNQLEEIKTLEQEITRLKNVGVDVPDAYGEQYTENFKKSITSRLEGVFGLNREYKYNDDYVNYARNTIAKLTDNINTGQYDKVAKSLKEISNIYNELILKNQEWASSTAIDKLITRISKFVNTNSSMGSGLAAQFKEIQDALSVPGGLSKSDYNTYLEKTIALENQVYKSGKTGASMMQLLSTKIKGMTASWAAMYLSMYDIVRYTRRVITNVTELDTAMTELRKVSDASTSRLNQDFETSAETANELGSSIKDVINATADWSRLGYSVDEAEKLAKVSTLYVNVGDNINMEEANQSLISTLQGYKLSADNAERIIDKFNEVANNYAIDSAGIGEALQRSAASFNAANTSLSESIALVTATNEVVQNPEKVGNMWKTVSARIRGAKAELEDMGEDTDGMVTSTSKLRDLVQGITGFDIMEDENTFKSIYQIVVGIGKEWDKLTDVNRAALLEALAGKVQSNALAAALNNVDQLEAVYNTAETSEGSAQREQENYEKSIQYSLDKAKAQLEEMSTDLLDSAAIKGLITLGSEGLDLIDKLTSSIGLLGIAFSTFFSIMGVKHKNTLGAYITGLGKDVELTEKIEKNVEGMTERTKKLSTALSNAGKSASAVRNALDRNDFGKGAVREYALTKGAKTDVQSLQNVQRGELAATLSSNNYRRLGSFQAISEYNNLLKVSKEQAFGFASGVKEQNANLGRFLTNLNGGQASMLKYAGSVTKATASTLAQSVATGLLDAGIGMLVGVIINAAVSAIDSYVNRVKYAKEAIEDLNKTYKENAEELQNHRELTKTVKEDYFELAKGVDTFSNKNIDLSNSEYERFIELNNQLAEAFPTLKTGLDAEGNAIINLGSNASVATEKLEELLKKEQEYNNYEVAKNIDTELKDTYTVLSNLEAPHDTQVDKKKQEEIGKFINDIQERNVYDQVRGIFYKLQQTQGDGFLQEVYNDAFAKVSQDDKRIIDVFQTYPDGMGMDASIKSFSQAELITFVKDFTESLTQVSQDIDAQANARKSEVETYLAPLRANIQTTAQTMTDYNRLGDRQILVDKMINSLTEKDIEDIQGQGGVRNYLANITETIKNLTQAEAQQVEALLRDSERLAKNTDGQTIDKLYKSAKNDVEKYAANVLKDTSAAGKAKAKAQLGLDEVYETVAYRDKIVAQASGRDFGSQKAVQFGTDVRDFSDQETILQYMNKYSINTDKELTMFRNAIMNPANVNILQVMREYENMLGAISSTDVKFTPSFLEFKEAWDELDNDITNENYSGAFKRFDFNSQQMKNLSEFKNNVYTLAQNGQLSVKAFRDLKGSTEFLKAVGLDAENAADKINKMIDPVSHLASMKTGITSITSAYTEKKEDRNKIVGADTLNSMYSTLGVENWSKENKKVWEEYKKAAGDSEMSMDEFKKHQDELATSYVNSEAFLENLTEANKDYYTSLLTEMGVTNADEVVQTALTQSYRAEAKAKKLVGDVDLSKVTYDEYTEMVNLKDQTEYVQRALRKLWVEKNKVFESPLDTKESVDNLIQLGKEIKTQALNIIELESLKKLNEGKLKGLGQEQISAIQRNADNAKKRIRKDFDDNQKVETKTVKTTKGNKDTDKGDQNRNKKNTKTKSTKTEIDWIEKKLTRLQNVISLTQARLQNLFTVKDLNKNLSTQINQNEKLLKSYSVAVSKYSKKARQALNAIGGKKKGNKALRKEVKTRYNTGALSGSTPLKKLIKEYGEKEATRIQKYLEYVDKENNAAVGKQNTIKAIRDSKIQKYTNKSEYEQATLAAMEARKENATTAKAKEKILDKERKHIKNNYNAQISAAKLEMKNAKNAKEESVARQKIEELREQRSKDLLENQIEQYQNYKDEADALVARYEAEEGNLVTAAEKNKLVNKEVAKTKESYEYQKKIAKARKDTTELARLEAEEEAKLVELQKKRFDNVIDYYSRLLTLNKNAYQQDENMLSIISARGLVADRKIYEDQLKIINGDLAQYNQELVRAEKELASLPVGSEEWVAAKDSVQNIRDNIADSTVKAINLETSIRNIAKQLMDIAHARIDIFEQENSLMEKYLSYGKMVEDGGYTAEGLSSLAMYYSDANYERQQLQDVDDRIKKFLNGRTYDQLNANEKNEYDEFWKQQIDLQNQYYDNMTKIADLEKERLESYKEYIQELINKRKELLQAEKDAYDYEKNIAQKTQTIATLQKQIQSIRGDDSEGAKSRLQELQVRLDEANEDLRETEYNQWLSDQQNMLDNLYNEFADLLEKLEQDRERLIKDALKGVNTYTETISKTLDNYMAKNPEYGFSQYFTNVTSALSSGGAIDNTLKQIETAIDNNTLAAQKDASSRLTSDVNAEASGNTTVPSNFGTGLKGDQAGSVKAQMAAADAQKLTKTAKTETTTKSNNSAVNGTATVSAEMNKEAKKVKITADTPTYMGAGWHEGKTGHHLKKGKTYYIEKEKNGWVSVCKKDPKKWEDIGNEFYGYVPKSKYKPIAYAKGGVVENLKRMPLANHDDAWITVGQGERVLTQAQNEAFEKLMNNLDVLNPSLENMTKANTMPATISNNNTNIGDINVSLNLPNVQNYNDLVREMQKDAKFENLVKSIVLDRNSMSKYNVRW